MLCAAACVAGPRPALALFASTATHFAQCDVMVYAPGCGAYGFGGVVERPDGTVLVSSFIDCANIVLSFPASATCPATPESPALLPGSGLHGMVFGLDGRLYATRGFNQVVEVDPADGLVLRQVTPLSSTWIAALGIAVDPRTGDLYTSNGPQVWRVADPAGPSPVATLFSDLTALGANLDGCSFSCDGAYLLAADENNSKVFRIERDGTSSLLVALPAGTAPDGICFGTPGTPLFGNAYTNNNNGSVTEIPLANPSWSRTIASGSGLRGDFLTVDSSGDLLVTQNSRVTRLWSTQQGRFELPGATLCGNMECAARADLNCIRQHGIRTSIRVAIPFICDPTNPPNARLARTCNSIDKIKKHAPWCLPLLTAFRAMRDHLMTLAATPDCSGE